MKKQNNYKNLIKKTALNLCLLLTIFLMTYCGGTNILENPTTTTGEPDIVVTNTSVAPASKTVAASTKTVNVQLKFTPISGKKLTRIYITRNAFGNGDMPYRLEGFEIDKKTTRATLKADGSIDLPSSMSDAVNFIMPLPVKLPGETETEGTIVYRIWATGGSFLGGKGDHRDPSNENVIATASPHFAKVVIKLGTVESTAQMQTKTVTLNPPLANGSSNTFFSLLTCEAQKINAGPEVFTNWDFGYVYLNATGAALESAKVYQVGSASTLTTKAMAGLTDEQEGKLNACYFMKDATPMTDDAFNALTVATINAQSITKTDATQVVEGLVVGSTVKFEDKYGKKGVIMVTSLTTGTGTNGAIGLKIKFVP